MGGFPGHATALEKVNAAFTHATMKRILCAFALTLATAASAHAGDVFHRSHEGGMSVYRGIVQGPTSAAILAESERERLAIARQRADAEARYLNALGEAAEVRANAEARYLRALEKRDNAYVRGVASRRYVPRYRGSNFVLVANTRGDRRRVRRRHR